jgi:putative metallohydrolase (TIGR04338 family)
MRERKAMAKTKPRDSQKQRVYTSQNESGLLYSEKALTIRESQKFVNKVVAGKTAKALFEKYRFPLQAYPTTIVVEASNGSHATFARNGWATYRAIRLNNAGRIKLIILHEVAHHITWGHEAHGAEFTDVYTKLVRRYIGKDAYDTLITSFSNNRVKVMGASGKARIPRKPKRKIELLAS